MNVYTHRLFGTLVMYLLGFVLASKAAGLWAAQPPRVSGLMVGLGKQKCEDALHESTIPSESARILQAGALFCLNM